MSGPTLAGLVADVRRRLQDAAIPDPAQDARLLVTGVLGLTPARLIADGSRALTPDESDAVEDAVRRRLAREPVHRILGRRAFFDLDLLISADTLEPRPDTEVLVDRLVPFVQAVVARKGECRILDLGTGTGAICLALLDLVPGTTGVGADISPGALETARRNADLNHLADRFQTLESNWFDAVTGTFDVIVSNPPYIATASMGSLDEEVRIFDPPRALDGGPDGLDAYRAIADAAAAYLRQDGYVAFEIGYDQNALVTTLMQGHGYHLVEAARDLGGNDRVLIFSRGE